MMEMTPLKLAFCVLIVSSIIFVLIAPSGVIGKVIGAIGNVIQQIVAWVKSLFSK